jgi:glycosyltransferase involved in cell wall biosynthesis
MNASMRLVIVHYHLRPGGIRRVIEIALPHLLRAAPSPVTEVVLATGELPDDTWHRLVEKLIAPVPLRFFTEPAFGYFSEQRSAPPALRTRIAASLNRLLREKNESNCLVWAHNLGIGRNLLLARELSRRCAEQNIPLAAHHHDWWFDNRWKRWPEMRRCGFTRFDQVAQTVLADTPNARQFLINRFDARPIERYFGSRAQWLPNLTDPPPVPSRARRNEVRVWLNRKLKDHGAPVWLLPCRLLRRKNVAEALLLARWLRPEAWLVTTGDVSSADERAYAAKLSSAARHHHWRLRLGVLAGDESRKPSVPELLAACECVLLTSIQEGFGLPYLEAAATGRPLIARALPNVAPDLAKFGFDFPQNYNEILVCPTLLDWPAEVKRQNKLFRAWRNGLPPASRRLAQPPVFLESPRSVQSLPFSRLTLTAQLEVLTQPVAESWKLCAPLNPFLAVWKRRAGNEQLQPTAWPDTAAQWLSGEAYARRFWRTMRTQPAKISTSRRAGVAAQSDLMRAKLDRENLFALLWSNES